MASSSIKPLKDVYGEDKKLPWTMVNSEVLKDKGWLLEDPIAETYYHPQVEQLISTIRVKFDEESNVWSVWYMENILRTVKHMYQIDNLVHGFTDKWLGYI